jgi:hypothetical protein
VFPPSHEADEAVPDSSPGSLVDNLIIPFAFGRNKGFIEYMFMDIAFAGLQNSYSRKKSKIMNKFWNGFLSVLLKRGKKSIFAVISRHRRQKNPARTLAKPILHGYNKRNTASKILYPALKFMDVVARVVKSLPQGGRCDEYPL